MAAQLSGASAKFRRERREERYAHRKKLRAATLKTLLLLMADGLYGFADCFHGCGDNSLRRVGFNVSKSPAPDFPQLLMIRESIPQNICQGLNIASGKDKLRVHRSYEIAGSSDLIADNYRTTAAHGLVYDYRERFID